MNQQVSDHRRPYQSEAGDSLLVPGNPIEAGFTYTHYQRGMGVAADQLVTSPLLAVPIPVPKPGQEERPRFNGARPEMMWHPLMWLPDSVTTRAEFDGRTETIDEFALRVGLQLSESGLYDLNTGTWLDVLAHGGLDIDAPEDVERVRQWMVGGHDALLDELAEMVQSLLDMRPEASPELAEHLGVTLGELQTLEDEYDELYAHRSARESVEFLRECGFAMSAEAMIDALDDLVSEDESSGGLSDAALAADDYWKPGLRQSLTVTFIQLTRQFLQGADGVDRLAQLEEDVAAFEGSEAELLEGPVASFREVLERVRHQYQVMLEELHETTSELAGEQTDRPALTELAGQS